MPILSNLSRRFHMLTTDAKPDPPRIDVNGYTYNLDPNTTNNEQKEESKSKSKSKSKPKPKSVPTGEDPRSEETHEIASEKKKSQLNDAIPTNTPHFTINQDFDDTKPSPDTKQQRQPNARTKTKSKQYRYSPGARVVNYNIVNSNGVKLGSRTTYICNVNHFPTKNTGSSVPEESWTKSEFRQMPAEVERLCACTDEMNLEDIFLIKTHIGHGWKDVARRLLYSDGQIEQFEENYRFRGISEVIYQIFLDWKQANTKDAEIGNVINVLWDCQEYDCAERLASSRKNSA